MGAQTTLGVVIPTLDEERALPRLLERLSSGPAEDRADRIVVADGGSRDGTRACARNQDVSCVESRPGRGIQLARGAAELDCELLCFLHADCVPQVGALARVRQAFGDPALGYAGLDQRIEAAGLAYRCIEWCANRRVQWLGLVWGDSGLVVRRAVYRAAGGFKDQPIFEDVDLSLRLRRRAAAEWLSGARLCVSPRRWRARGVLRGTLSNWMLTAAYCAGVDPKRLARHYPPNRADSA